MDPAGSVMRLKSHGMVYELTRAVKLWSFTFLTELGGRASFVPWWIAISISNRQKWVHRQNAGERIRQSQRRHLSVLELSTQWCSKLGQWNQLGLGEGYCLDVLTFRKRAVMWQHDRSGGYTMSVEDMPPMRQDFIRDGEMQTCQRCFLACLHACLQSG
jgi:hypothetical protein